MLRSRDLQLDRLLKQIRECADLRTLHSSNSIFISLSLFGLLVALIHLYNSFHLLLLLSQG